MHSPSIIALPQAGPPVSSFTFTRDTSGLYAMRKRIYLILAVIGAILPYFFYLSFMGDQGMALSGFIAATLVNDATTGLTMDLLISAVVFWIFLFHDRPGPSPWPFIALTLLIGLSCALPAYLYARTPREPAGA